MNVFLECHEKSNSSSGCRVKCVCYWNTESCETAAADSSLLQLCVHPRNDQRSVSQIVPVTTE